MRGKSVTEMRRRESPAMNKLQNSSLLKAYESIALKQRKKSLDSNGQANTYLSNFKFPLDNH